MKNETIKISIIIPVYNRKKILLNSLKSIFKQTRYDLIKEIIVVDDHSSFSVKKYVETNLESIHVKKIRYIRNSKNMGPAYSRNVGSSIAGGNIISFFDSDDLWHSQFIEEVAKHFLSSRYQVYMSFTFPKFYKVNNNLTILKHIILSLYRNVIMGIYSFFNDGILPIEYFYVCRLSSMAFDAKVISKIKFDKDYKSAEDWKYVYEALSKNKTNIFIIPKYLSSYLVHTESETLGRSEYFKYYRKLIDEVSIKHKNKVGLKLFKLYAHSSK